MSMNDDDHWLSQAVLQGRHVRLEPLTLEHVEPLSEAVLDGQLWQCWYTTVPSPQQMQIYIENAMAAADRGNIVYAVFCKKLQRIVGTTRFYQVNSGVRRASIGYTWYAKSAQGTAVNAETKLLMMHYLFELKQAVAVEFVTHSMNKRSRCAIEALGAKLDGILRHHMRLPNDTLRDSAFYSIIESEWPMVKLNLQERIKKHL